MLIHAIIRVLVFPPNESFRILVNLESLYGICVLAIPGVEVPFFLCCDRILIQFPKASKLLLIFAPSVIPFGVLTGCIFSDPAKSIMNIFAVLLSSPPLRISTVSCWRAWEREL